MAVEWKLIEGGRMLQQLGMPVRASVPVRDAHALAERQMEEELDQRISSPPRPHPWP
jgi:hypothetical protein